MAWLVRISLLDLNHMLPCFFQPSGCCFPPFNVGVLYYASCISLRFLGSWRLNALWPKQSGHLIWMEKLLRIHQLEASCSWNHLYLSCGCWKACGLPLRRSVTLPYLTCQITLLKPEPLSWSKWSWLGKVSGSHFLVSGSHFWVINDDNTYAFSKIKWANSTK